jgi:hypothetical protein
MANPIGVVTGSGKRTKAKPATLRALCRRLRGFIIFISLLVRFIFHPHLRAHPVIYLIGVCRAETELRQSAHLLVTVI